jgi:hypothetical protein
MVALHFNAKKEEMASDSAYHNSRAHQSTKRNRAWHQQQNDGNQLGHTRADTPPRFVTIRSASDRMVLVFILFI